MRPGRYRRGRFAAALSLAYLAVMLGVQAWAQLSILNGAQAYPLVQALVVTAPLCLVDLGALYLLPTLFFPLFPFILTATGIVQAWLIWRILRGRRAFPEAMDHE